MRTTDGISEFEDGGEFGASSSRADRLGAVLKSGVSRLRGRAEADLVFLVDSSASVGADNFHNEIKFVRKVSESTKGSKQMSLPFLGLQRCKLDWS